MVTNGVLTPVKTHPDFQTTVKRDLDGKSQRPTPRVTAAMPAAAFAPSARPRTGVPRACAARWTCSVTAAPAARAAAKGGALPAGMRHFLHVDDMSADALRAVLEYAAVAKRRLDEPAFAPIAGKAMALVFAKPSARTRVSFETGVFKMGGHALVLGPEVGVNTREAAKDVSRVLSGMTDIIMARLFAHADILEMAEYATVPVINGLTDYNHPCQIVADALTIIETRGSLDGVKLVYVGDGNNMVHSWLELAARIPIDFTCCCPEGYVPDMEVFNRVRDIGISKVSISHDPKQAVVGADYIYTDVWASMGQKEETTERERAFQGFQVNGDLFRATGTDKTKLLHCLPAERGRECTDEVMEAPYSVVFQQAENRMHAQNAIILSCLGLM